MRKPSATSQPQDVSREYNCKVEKKRRKSRPAANLTGTYVGHARGFGFFVTGGGGDDLFVPPGHEGEAIDGDTVEVQPQKSASHAIPPLFNPEPAIEMATSN